MELTSLCLLMREILSGAVKLQSIRSRLGKQLTVPDNLVTQNGADSRKKKYFYLNLLSFQEFLELDNVLENSNWSRAETLENEVFFSKFGFCWGLD